MKRCLLGAILLVGASMTLGPRMSAAGTSLSIPGTGSSQVLLKALAEAFLKGQPDARVDVPESVGSGGAIKAVGEGRAVLGRVARKVKEKEKSYGLAYVGFARVPVVFAAYPSSKVKALTVRQSADVFAGTLTNWRSLGGPDKKIRIITRAEGESTLDALREALKPWQGLKVTPQSKVADVEAENVDLIAATDGAIGYTVYDAAVKKGLTVFALDGISPKDAAYPAQMEFGLVYKPALSGPAKLFLDFLQTSTAAKVMRDHGATPLSHER